MKQALLGPWVIGRARSALLAVVALAAVADIATYAVLVARDGDEPSAPPGPDEVARSVVQAVADEECDDLDDLLTDDAVLPSPVTGCMAGRPLPAELSEVSVDDTSTDGASSTVTVGLDVDGSPARILVDLRRVDGGWSVSAIRAAP